MSSPAIQPETVEALVQNVRGLITDEEQRASSLMSRGSGLAGFAGIILALAGVGARSTHGLGGLLRPIVVGLASAAFVSLALAVVIVVVGLLVPRGRLVVSAAEFTLYADDVLSSDRVVVQRVFLRGLMRSLQDERRSNKRGAAALRVGYALVCVGLVLVTVSVLPWRSQEVSMADREAPARDEPKPPADANEFDPDDFALREPEMEYSEPGPDVWGFLERVWRRLKRVDEAA